MFAINDLSIFSVFRFRFRSLACSLARSLANFYNKVREWVCVTNMHTLSHAQVTCKRFVFCIWLSFNWYPPVTTATQCFKCKISSRSMTTKYTTIEIVGHLPKTFSWWTLAIPVQLIYNLCPLFDILFVYKMIFRATLYLANEEEKWKGKLLGKLRKKKRIKKKVNIHKSRYILMSRYCDLFLNWFKKGWVWKLYNFLLFSLFVSTPF